MANIRCGVIGYGGALNMGRAHATYIQQTDGLELTAVCDTDPSRTDAALTDFEGIQTFNSIDELLASDAIDLAIIVLPHNLHAPVAIQCAQAGKHVVVEKPMCITVDEATRMIDASKAAGKMLSVFHNRRQDSDYRTLRELIVDKKIIGDVFKVEVFSGHYSQQDPKIWRTVKSISGGYFYDWGAHFLDWLLGIIPGPIENVSGHFHKRVWHEVTNEDHVEATIRFASGCVANVQMSSIAHAGKPRWWVLGDKGAIVDKGGYFEVTGDFEHQGYPATLRVPYRNDSEWKTYYSNVAAHLRDGGELGVKPEQARRVIAVLETAERSSEQGQALPLPTEATDAAFTRSE
ncbi:MAG TPA: Gfo/Idh/MocA family oxidoreductase [Abditibacteriaceae bacterium]